MYGNFSYEEYELDYCGIKYDVFANGSVSYSINKDYDFGFCSSYEEEIDDVEIELTVIQNGTEKDIQDKNILNYFEKIINEKIKEGSIEYR